MSFFATFLVSQVWLLQLYKQWLLLHAGKRSFEEGFGLATSTAAVPHALLQQCNKIINQVVIISCPSVMGCYMCRLKSEPITPRSGQVLDHLKSVHSNAD